MARLNPYMLNYQKPSKWLKGRATQFRANMTSAEELLWAELKCKKTGYHFVRQKCLHGKVADFYCHKQKTLVEVDGKTHDKNKDAARDRHLGYYGYRTIRVRAYDVYNNMPFAIATIKQKMDDRVRQRSSS